MNRCVPDFEMDDDYSIPTSSALNRPRKSTVRPDDEIMELLWQNGQVVMQSQNQRSSLGSKKPSKYDAVLPHEDTDNYSRLPTASQPQPAAQNNHHQLFMQEDEMASWLQYPLVDDPFCTDLLYPDSSAATAELRQPPVSAVPASKPPIHPPRRTDVQNFLHFSSRNNNNNNNNNNKARVSETAPSSCKSVVRETTTVVDSNDNPLVGLRSRILDSRPDGGGGVDAAATSFATASAGPAATSFGGKEAMTCEMSLTSSPGGSSASASASAEPISAQKPAAAEDRKRKGREADDDAEFQSEDVEFESANGRKQVRGSSSTKRSRAAEVHNLSERRRRDRINEKMRALQELIPRCNKSDKASMLDEAIEYLKSLQLQVQMMSVGCGMVPMMFPGVQQYMPMGMGLGMGMGMGMGMEVAGISRPMMPFPNVLAGSPMPTAAPHLGPRFPMPPFHMPPIPANDPTRVQATNPSEQHMLNSLGAQNPNQPRMPNFPDSFQQYLTPQQMQLPLQQNQAMPQPSTGKPSSSRGPETHENH